MADTTTPVTFAPDDEVLVATQPDGMGEQIARVVSVDGEQVTVRFIGFGPVLAGRVVPMHQSDVRHPPIVAPVRHRDGLATFA